MKRSENGVQVRCPLCGKTIPVRVDELRGNLRLSIRCPQCKRVSNIELQDISADERAQG
ncbi:MAG: hypothetical protein J5382_10380 [Bacteroidales bacterium]|nr:hypothetical protein [Bacteroidales bacterium]